MNLHGECGIFLELSKLHKCNTCQNVPSKMAHNYETFENLCNIFQHWSLSECKACDCKTKVAGSWRTTWLFEKYFIRVIIYFDDPNIAHSSILVPLKAICMRNRNITADCAMAILAFWSWTVIFSSWCEFYMYLHLLLVNLQWDQPIRQCIVIFCGTLFMRATQRFCLD